MEGNQRDKALLDVATAAIGFFNPERLALMTVMSSEKTYTTESYLLQCWRGGKKAATSPAPPPANPHPALARRIPSADRLQLALGRPGAGALTLTQGCCASMRSASVQKCCVDAVGELGLRPETTPTQG